MGLLYGFTGQNKLYIATLLTHHKGARHLLGGHAVKQHMIETFRQRHINTHFTRFSAYQFNGVYPFCDLAKGINRLFQRTPFAHGVANTIITRQVRRAGNDQIPHPRQS